MAAFLISNITPKLLQISYLLLPSWNEMIVMSEQKLLSEATRHQGPSKHHLYIGFLIMCCQHLRFPYHRTEKKERRTFMNHIKIQIHFPSYFCFVQTTATAKSCQWIGIMPNNKVNWRLNGFRASTIVYPKWTIELQLLSILLSSQTKSKQSAQHYH